MRLDDLDLGVIFLQARLEILAGSETTDEEDGLGLVRDACIGCIYLLTLISSAFA
jgi:hypothetical protein